MVAAVVGNGLGSALRPLLPAGTSLPALLAIAALAAALANVCNNLPAVLVLLPLTAPSGAGAVLAVLLGVNIGPNLTYTGSLATLLWRRTLRRHSVVATELIDAAARRLGRPCERMEIHGQTERAVVAASAYADLLVVARDGDRSRLGPKSLGKAARFVVDHAACLVLLVWPGAAPDVVTIPAPPHHPHQPRR